MANLERDDFGTNRKASSPSPQGLSDSHIFTAIFAIINALNSFFLPSSRRTSGPRLSACVPVESLGPDFHRDDEKMKCLLGWPSNLWICKELWREMKFKKMCAYDSPTRGMGNDDAAWTHHSLTVVPSGEKRTTVGRMVTVRPWRRCNRS